MANKNPFGNFLTRALNSIGVGTNPQPKNTKHSTAPEIHAESVDLAFSSSDPMKDDQLIEELPEHLPPLPTETAPEPFTHFDLKLQPFKSLGNAKAFVIQTMDEGKKRSVDKITHLMPDLLQNGTIGLTLTDISTATEKQFRIRLDRVVTNTDEKKTWEEYFWMTFHPSTETVDVTVNQSMRSIVPPLVFMGTPEQIQAQIQAYEKLLLTAYSYLNAGMKRIDAAGLIQAKAKRLKK